MVLLLLAAAVAAAAPPAFADKPCADARLAGIARCGTVEVPENRQVAGGRRIALNVIVLQATSPGPHLPPLFDIDGGPGLPDTKNAGFYATDGSAYRARRDIVLIDQRGTGASNPLACPELADPASAFKPMLPPAAVARCRKALEAKADLSQYLTHHAVADLDAVRDALGYERIDLFGLSYGTTVALRYLAAHPDRVRAAVLMGVAPPHARPPASHATAAERALKLLFAQCRADAACGKAFNPAEDLDRALARLPAAQDAPPADVFTEKLRTMMYQPATARRIPWVIHRAADGDLAPFYEATRPSGPSPYFDGMFLSVTCAEGLALTDVPAAASAARATQFGDYRLRRQSAACAQWTVGKAASDFLGPVNSPAAVLLVSGGLDPVTPPEWAEAVAKALPNARHVVIPASGHVFDGLGGIDTCFDPLVVKFLDTGLLDGLDFACLDQMRPPPFAITGTTPKPGN